MRNHNFIALPADFTGARVQLDRQCGLTLVELMVAMVISAIIAIAAVSSLVISRSGFSAVDASSQIRDNARFASDLVQRLGVQTGFRDIIYATVPRKPPEDMNPVPNITGFNNALADSTDPVNVSTARTAGQLGFGSDILILRFQPSESLPGSGTVDRTMIDCAGVPASFVPANRDERVVSVLHVAVGANDPEPSLMCSTRSNLGVWSSQPIIRGVENFQVLYGVDGVVANTAPTAAATDSVASNFLRADQMGVSGNAVATNENWRRVRSIRIGMVLRGPPGSSQEAASQTYYPFGLAMASSGGTPGSALSSTNDAGTVFTPTADTRLRQVVTFTVHLRNGQER